MPNFDAGHYFLTVLVPVRMDSILIDGQSHSRRHLIREALADMPAGERTAAARGRAGLSPFAVNRRTHFCRFVALDDVVFNGRVSGNSLLSVVRRINPLVPQPVDRLTRPFLIFVVDFDAQSGADSELKGYLTDLWSTMAEELTKVFQHCMYFDAVKEAEGFYAYIKKCQIETTMPFNDYWALPPVLPDFSLRPYEVIALLIAAVPAIDAIGVPLKWTTWQPWTLWGAVLAILLLLAIGVIHLIVKALKPFPKAPAPALPGDLPTVLKSLFMQRAFTQFVIDMQGDNDQALYDAFGRFIAANRPDDPTEPTQLPGVIGV
jgi:hypothetical protein